MQENLVKIIDKINEEISLERDKWPTGAMRQQVAGRVDGLQMAKNLIIDEITRVELKSSKLSA